MMHHKVECYRDKFTTAKTVHCASIAFGNPKLKGSYFLQVAKNSIKMMSKW